MALTRARVAEAVAQYAPVVHGLADGHHVASPLGAWLVLALAGPAAAGGDREQLASALGHDPDEAAVVAARLLAHPHPLVAAAAALWWRDDPPAGPLVAYLEQLPSAVTREPLTGQAQVDAWAREHTLGLIDRFPLTVDEQVVLVLASALATRVSWDVPFDVVPAAELRGPFTQRVTRALRSPARHGVHLARTGVAGLVGVHVGRAAGGLAVVSTLAGTDVPHDVALAAAYEIAGSFDGHRLGTAVSLFDIDPGSAELAELGEVTEDVVSAPGDRPVEEGRAVLPTWRARTELKLLGDPATGFAAAGGALSRLVGGGPLDAKQVAVAAYDRQGFEAAAVTGIAVRASYSPRRELPRRTLTLRFGRPYAAVAVALAVDDPVRGQVESPWAGLPVFGAWIAEPAETDPE